MRVGLGFAMGPWLGLGLKFGLRLGLGYLVQLLLLCFLCFEVLEVKAHNEAFLPRKYGFCSHFPR